MKTAEVKTTGLNNNKVENKANDTTGNKAVSAGNETKAPAHNEVKKEEVKKAETPATVQLEQPKNEQSKTNVAQVEQPKAEAPKPVKPTMNLEETLKLVAELNRKKIQRDKLLETVENLEAFEVEIKEDADETDGNIYQGCVLTIEDDNRRKFTTKNPVIIFTVAQQVNAMCVDKLAEIEAGIILPA